jgi:hypothetical protein
LGREGRALVERRYRWETVVEGMEELYDRLLARPARVTTDGRHGL